MLSEYDWERNLPLFYYIYPPMKIALYAILCVIQILELYSFGKLLKPHCLILENAHVIIWTITECISSYEAVVCG